MAVDVHAFPTPPTIGSEAGIAVLSYENWADAIQPISQMSLEELPAMLRGLLRSVDKLPPFPRRSCVLADWPDLGTVADLTVALKVAGVLSRRTVDSAEVAALAEVDERQASACLWAFAASGLLRFERTGAASNPPAPATGLLAKLARHFGLARTA